MGANCSSQVHLVRRLCAVLIGSFAATGMKISLPADRAKKVGLTGGTLEDWNVQGRNQVDKTRFGDNATTISAFSRSGGCAGD